MKLYDAHQNYSFTENLKILGNFYIKIVNNIYFFADHIIVTPQKVHFLFLKSTSISMYLKARALYDYYIHLFILYVIVFSMSVFFIHVLNRHILEVNLFSMHKTNIMPGL